ncbi:hypothetical protein Dac01nite_20100 [Demequina activiva]|uniref:Uncharacterized protein n=2 Tax=Demequina activiva TaxID=1582364 RepID=A0A919UM18_9MICO|nr:hypothetical protein Dac01nite_20100 [Demequina activiva]
MGLLVGAHISSKLLELTDGSSHTLGELFPEIKHVRRFNMTPQEAKRILSNSDELLAQLAVPGVLAVHEDMMRQSVDSLKAVAPKRKHPKGNFNAKSMHDHFDSLAGGYLAMDSKQVFNYVRNSRNKHIHQGGFADREFEDDCALITEDSKRLWLKLTSTKIRTYAIGDRVELGFSHLIAALAVSKRLSEQVNDGLRHTLPRDEWLRIIEADWFDGPHAPKGANEAQRQRKLRGFVSMYYAPLEVTAEEIAEIVSSR